MKKITQQEARRLRDENASLKARHSSLCLGAPGTEIGTVTMARDWFMGRVEMAKKLGCAIVVTESNNTLTLRAVKPL